MTFKDPEESGDHSRDPEVPSRFSPAEALDLLRDLIASAQRKTPDEAASRVDFVSLRERAQRAGVDLVSLDVEPRGAAEILCRLLTVQPLTAFARSPKVKRQIPRHWQGLLEQALGGGSLSQFRDLQDFLHQLESAENDTATENESTLRPAPPGDPTEAPAPAPTASHPDVPFPALAHYQVKARLGGGGMGEVYLAFEPALDRTVALKVLPRELARSADFVQRFRAEAAAAAKLQHPHIVPIYFIGEDAGHLFFAMQHIEGESLAQRLHRDPKLSPDETVSIIRQVLTGLSAAHRRGLVHRDIKPGNILLDRENQRALVADFGLAKSFESSITGRTAAGVVMGTVDYIAPEQGRGQSVDARSDLYAVGVMMYQMLAGRLPFSGEGPAVLIFQHVYEPPPPLKAIAPEVSGNLAALVERLLSKLPEDRFQSADEVLVALDAVASGRPLPDSPRRTDSAFKRRTAWILGALSTVALIVVAASLVWRNLHPPDPGRVVENNVERESNAQQDGEKTANDSPVVAENDQTSESTQHPPEEQVSPEPEPVAKPASQAQRPEITYGNSEASGFRDTIRSMAFKPFYDGQIGFGIALAAEDGSLSYISRLHNRMLSRYPGFGGRHLDAVEQIVFSPDGTRIASACSDGTIGIWKLNGGRQIRQLVGHTKPVSAIRFSADGEMLLSGSPDGTVRLWNILEERAVKQVALSQLLTAVQSMSWSADGKQFLVGVDLYGGRSLALWDLEQGRSVRVYDTLKQPSTDVFIVPDGRHLISQTRGVMKVWEIGNEEAELSFGGGIRKADYNFDGRLALTANADHSLTLWSVGEGKPIIELEGPGATITSIAISKDGRCAARARDDGTLRVFDLPLPERLVHVFEDHEGPITSVAFSPDSTGAISASTDGRITNLRPADRANSGFHPISQPLSAVAYARDATRFLYATAVPSSKTNVVGLINLGRNRRNREPRQFSGPEDVITSAAFSSDGRQVAAGSVDGTVRVWEVQTEVEKRVLRPGVPIYCVALSPVARSLLLAGGADNDLWLWDLDDEAAERRLRGHTSHVLSACFNDDGKFAVTGGIDRTVRIWNMESDQVLRVLSGHTDRVNSVAVSKDGRLVLSASDDRTVRVWDFDSGKTLAVLRGHVAAVRSVAISPDGLSALSGSDDRTARLWDLTGLADAASAE